MVESIQYRSYPQAVRQVFSLFNEGLLKLDPAFQRSGVWQLKQRVHLLESIFQGYAAQFGRGLIVWGIATKLGVVVGEPLKSMAWPVRGFGDAS
jgi:hypothetical protein